MFWLVGACHYLWPAVFLTDLLFRLSINIISLRQKGKMKIGSMSACSLGGLFPVVPTRTVCAGLYYFC